MGVKLIFSYSKHKRRRRSSSTDPTSTLDMQHAGTRFIAPWCNRAVTQQPVVPISSAYRPRRVGSDRFGSVRFGRGYYYSQINPNRNHTQQRRVSMGGYLFYGGHHGFRLPYTWHYYCLCCARNKTTGQKYVESSVCGGPSASRRLNVVEPLLPGAVTYSYT